MEKDFLDTLIDKVSRVLKAKKAPVKLTKFNHKKINKKIKKIKYPEIKINKHTNGKTLRILFV